MKKNRIFLCIGLLSLLSIGTLKAATDYLSICKNIPVTTLEHPYLVFNNQDKQKILQLAERDPQARMTLEALEAEAQRYLLTLPTWSPRTHPPFSAPVTSGSKIRTSSTGSTS